MALGSRSEDPGLRRRKSYLRCRILNSQSEFHWRIGSAASHHHDHSMFIFIRPPRFCCVWKLLCWRLLNVRPATWKLTFCLSLFVLQAFCLCGIVRIPLDSAAKLMAPKFKKLTGLGRRAEAQSESQSQFAWERQEVSGRRQPSFA